MLLKKKCIICLYLIFRNLIEVSFTLITSKFSFFFLCTHHLKRHTIFQTHHVDLSRPILKCLYKLNTVELVN